MQDFGQLILMVTFFVTLATSLTAAAGALTRNAMLMRSARYGVWAVAGLNVAMALILSHSFLTHDFSNKYVTAYSDRTMPTIYLIASFWGGEKGALLFWTTSLSVFSAIAIHTRRHREPVYLSWVASVLMGALFFFFILMVFESSPFESFAAMTPPADGNGLNPQLQNPTMAFHPPSLLTGYITFTIPFAFAMAALITGKLDVQWITDTRVWTIISWCFLSIGLVLGMLWAYEELGWGFYWMWDPVENAGAIPWFTGTAFLHSVMVQERRGMLKRWNVILVCLTFLLTIAGTFLTRSQLIDSIHAFANSTLANYFLVYMIVILVISIVAIAYRWRDLAPEARIESMYSRESMFVLNNLFLVGCAFIVIWGTVFPKISELAAVQAFYNAVADGWNGTLGTVFGTVEHIDQALNLGEVWFNAVIAPIGIMLLLIMGIGPLIPWRTVSWASYQKQLLAPITIALAFVSLGSVVHALLEVRALSTRYELTFLEAAENYALSLGLTEAYVFLSYTFCIYVGWTMLREFYEGAKVRQAKSGESFITSLIVLTFKVPRRYGGYIIHMGVVLMFVAFTGKAFKFQEPERAMAPGDTIAAQDYHVTYTGSTYGWQEDDGFASTKATLSVLKTGETVAAQEVDDLAEWLTASNAGVFHIETALERSTMRVRFQDHGARDRIRDDVFLKLEFLPNFRLVGEDPFEARQTWRLQDEELLKVVPMVAMQRVRQLKAHFGPASTFGAVVEARGGSPEVALDFDDADTLAAFKARTESANLPPDILLGRYHANSGALDFVDRRTGMLAHPEVRFYAKHDTPTTETAISSTLSEDLYLAMRPAMGQDFINVLVVVFPLVGFLWVGSIILLLGTLVCLTPRWLSRTMIQLAQSGGAARPAVATVAAGVFVAVVLFGLQASGSVLPEPTGIAPPPAGQALSDIEATLNCPCDTQDPVDRTLADGPCDCPAATRDRVVLAELFSTEAPRDRASGKAKLNVLTRLVQVDGTYDARLRYDRAVYHQILETTKTTCPGERGLVISQSQLSCTVRNRWLPRFRLMLASGMSVDAIYKFYVDENNVTMAPELPWTYEDLKAAADKPLSWALPAAALFLFIVALFIYALRQTKANRLVRAGAPLAASGSLSERERLILEDELDMLDAGS